jgi:hypothetical protein
MLEAGAGLADKKIGDLITKQSPHARSPSALLQSQPDGLLHQVSRKKGR